MLDPTGPLPAAVYWRRRVVAMSGVTIVVALAVWAVSGFFAGRRAAPPPVVVLPSAPAAPPPVQDCPDQAIRVAVEPVKPEFRLNERVGLRMSVTNISRQSCRRDTNRLLRELIVSGSEGQRVWSSNDCYAESASDVPVLEPDRPKTWEVTWLVATSAPGCPLHNVPAPPGEYSVVAKLGPLASSPAPMRIG